MRQGLQNVGRRARRVQEKADPVAMAARTQFAREKHQVIIVHPDDVVLVDQRAQVIRKQAVDAHVAARVSARIFLQVDAVVENGPEHAVGETVAIFLDVVVRQFDLDIGHIVDFESSRLAGRLVGHLAAPAKPHAVLILEHSFHRHRHFVSERGMSLFRQSDPVGYYDDPRAHPSSQVGDRVAVASMLPAMTPDCLTTRRCLGECPPRAPLGASTYRNGFEELARLAAARMARIDTPEVPRLQRGLGRSQSSGRRPSPWCERVHPPAATRALRGQESE